MNPQNDPRLRLLDAVSEVITAGTILEHEQRGLRSTSKGQFVAMIPALMQLRDALAVRGDMGQKPQWMELLAERFLSVATEHDAEHIQRGLTELAAVCCVWKMELAASRKKAVQTEIEPE